MQTFVLSHFNFFPTLWHFCKSCDTLKIEKAQYRALKYVFSVFNSSYDILTRGANVPSWYTRRRKTVLLGVYKAYHFCEPQYLSELFKKQRDEYHTRNRKALVQHKCNSTTGYIVLSMKERECGISSICLLEVRVVRSGSKIF